MNLKIIIPWLLAVVGLAAAGYFYSAAGSKDNELAALQAQAAEAAQLRTENAELKKLEGNQGELERLRKDNEDLLKLRAEVHQLRDEKKAFAAQLQSAEGKVQAAQEQAQSAQSRAQSAQAQAESLRAAQQAQQLAGGQNQIMCVNNLRQIDGAKQQWALEYRKSPADVPTQNDIVRYLANGLMPKCPGGGTYSLNAVNTRPTCSIPGHQLQ